MKNFWFTFLSCGVVLFGSRGWAAPGDVDLVSKATQEFLHRKLGTGFEADLERKARTDLYKKASEAWSTTSLERREALFLELSDTYHTLGRIAYGRENFDVALRFFFNSREFVGMSESKFTPAQYNRETEHIFQTYFDAGIFWESKGELKKAYSYFDKAAEFFKYTELSKTITTSQIIGIRYYALLHRIQARPHGYCWQIL